MSDKEEMYLRNPSITADDYCSKEKYLDHQLEHYKIYAETVDKLSDRRILTNTFFLTIHTLIIGMVGFSYNSLLALQYKLILILPLIGVGALCYSWRRMLQSYKQISAAKFRVIGEFEKYLPAQPFLVAEWSELGKGNNPKLYKPLTDSESWIPVIFASLYFIGFIVLLLTNAPIS